MMIRYLQTRDPMVVWTLHIVAGYLLGSIMFCRWIPKLVLHKDVCALSDDHNPGAANVFQHCGVPAGLLCLFFDLSKGFLPVYLAAHTVGIEPMQFAAVMMAPVLGHATAPFDHFSGGKCIATAFGVLLALVPMPTVLFLAVPYIFFSVAWVIKPNRVRSIVAFAVFAAAACTYYTVTGLRSVGMGCGLIAGVAIVRHLDREKFRRVKESAAE